MITMQDLAAGRTRRSQNCLFWGNLAPMGRGSCLTLQKHSCIGIRSFLGQTVWAMYGSHFTKTLGTLGTTWVGLGRQTPKTCPFLGCVTFGRSTSNGTEIRRKKKWPLFLGHRHWHGSSGSMTSYQWSIVTMDLSRTVSEIKGDFVRNLEIFITPCI